MEVMMKKSMIMPLCVIVAMTLLYWAPQAGAYDNYSIVNDINK
jgi:uncharacterized membrane protein YwzB